MKKAVIVTNFFYKKNRLFDIKDKIANRDNCLYPFYLLRQNLRQNNIDLVTSDLYQIEKAEFAIYNDMPLVMPNKNYINKSYLILLENKIIKPANWETIKFKYFKKIFTWHDALVDNKKFFKINYTYNIPESIPKDLSKKTKLCTLIAGNKKSSHPNELYTKRIETIRWFECKHPLDFDLYGTDWNEYRTKNKYINFLLSKVRWLGKIFKTSYPSYKGKVEDKLTTFQKYKFAICYENAVNISGYISEKIFDCFFSGCVPIYLGTNNIKDHIPKECFIDRRDYANHEALYEYISKINDNEYMKYLYAIEAYIKSPKIFQFSNKAFTETIIKEIKNDIKTA